MRLARAGQAADEKNVPGVGMMVRSVTREDGPADATNRIWESKAVDPRQRWHVAAAALKAEVFFAGIIRAIKDMQLFPPC